MLKKLLKYELSAFYKFIYPFYGLALLFALLTRMFLSFEGNLAAKIIGEIFRGACISMFCSSLVNNFMRLMVRFRQSLYGDESYLLHTLPLTRGIVYGAKIVTVLITFFTSFLFTLASLAIMFCRADFFQTVKDFVAQLTETTGGNVWLLVIGMLALLWLEFINLQQCVFTGIILGHRRADHKMGFSFLFGAVAYLVGQGITLAIIAILAIFNQEIQGLFVRNQMPSTSTFCMLIWIFAGVYLLLVAGFWKFNVRCLNQGVDVE